jgi:NAD-dependent dihydropyrimidine dehydrogenase PreA subunit
MTTWLTPLPVRDAYDVITRKLGYPSSATLRKILELAMSLEEAELLLAMPGTIESLAAKVNRDSKVVKDQIERMYWVGLIMEQKNSDGTVTYTQPTPFWSIETTSDQMMWALGSNPNVPKSGKTTAQDLWGKLDNKTIEICDLWNKFFYEEWYRWQRPNELVHRNMEMLGGAAGLARTFGIMPAVVSLMKSEVLGTEILPEWDLREIARRAEKGIYSRVCTCRTRAKGCDFPLWTCGAYWDGMPGRDVNAEVQADRRSQLHKHSGEEWLELMIRAEEDQMMVHIGDPWFVVCNCCRDCCNWLVPLCMYSAEPWEGVHPSPYRAVVNSDLCEGCTQDCFPRCAFKVIEEVKEPSTGKVKPYIDPDKCTGCGQCVVGCKVQGAIKMELAEKAGAHVPVMGGRAKVPESILGPKPNIPRPR